MKSEDGGMMDFWDSKTPEEIREIARNTPGTRGHAEHQNKEIIRQLERAASRIGKGWRKPSFEGAMLDLFMAFEPTRKECPDIEINGIMINAMIPRPDIAAARLQAIATVERILRKRYGADTEMNRWCDAPDRTKEEVVAVIQDAIEMASAAPADKPSVF